MGTITGVPRPATGKTPIKNFRISQEMWDAAVAIAEARGETVTDVLVRAVAAYIKRYGALAPEKVEALRRKRTARELMTGKPEGPAERRMRGQDPPA